MEFLGYSNRSERLITLDEMSEWDQRRAQEARQKRRSKALAGFCTRVGLGAGLGMALLLLGGIANGLWVWLGWWAVITPLVVGAGFGLLYGAGMAVQRVAEAIKAHW